MKVRYFDISWQSGVDGPGWRVVLFLQGCHLRCPWCHSPHSRENKSPLIYFENRCIHCGACIEACPTNAHFLENGKHQIDRSRCKGCGICIEHCPVSRKDEWKTGALGFAGTVIEVKALFQLLEPQLELLKNIGGLTVSGGEPLLQPEALRELLELCRSRGFHTAVETSASLPRKNILSLLKLVDRWLIGLRPVKKKNNTIGNTGDWELIIKNLEFLASRCRDKITIRTPIIPGYTDTKNCLGKIAAVMKANRLTAIEILPYNPHSQHYYEAAGKPYPLKGSQPIKQSRLINITEYFSSQGFKVKIPG